MSKGFNSIFSQNMRLKQENMALKTKMAKYELQISNLKRISQFYKDQYSLLKEELLRLKTTNTFVANIQKHYPILFSHICALNKLKNPEDKMGKGNRFDPTNYPFYLLISMSGFYWTNLLHKTIGFPSISQCKRIKNNYKKKFSIDSNILDGSIDSITKLIQLILSKDDILNKRAVIAVDAAAVNAKIIIHKNGNVEGLIEDSQISEEMTSEIIKYSESFDAFYHMNLDDITKYYFVFYLCSLSNDDLSFPILMKRHINGSANSDFSADLDQLVLICRSIGLDVIGVAFDGDPQWLSYVDSQCQMIDNIDMLNLSLPLSEIFFTDSMEILVFEDVLHLLKCNRYRLVCGSSICPSLSSDIAFEAKEYEIIGIPQYVLDDSQMKKMDDMLPLLMFHPRNIEQALMISRYDLIISLLPSTLLVHAILSEEITRSERIEALTLGFCILMIYYFEYKDYSGKQSKRRDKGRNKLMTLFDPIWIKKYMSLTISLTRVIADRKEVHLGALGTHFLEHFFGMVRRFCKADDSASNFEKSVENILIYKLIQKENNSFQRYEQPHRISDSGIFLKEEKDQIAQVSFGRTLYKAYKIMGKVGEIGSKMVLKLIEKISFEDKIDIDEMEFDIKSLIPGGFKDGSVFNSSSKLRYNTTSGYTGLKRVASGRSK